MSYEDKTLVCKVWEEFVLPLVNKSFMREKGLTNEPARCRECRQKRKKEGGL